MSAIGVALAVLAALGLIALIAARFWPERNSGSQSPRLDRVDVEGPS